MKQDIVIQGPKGRISAIINKPELKPGEKCPMAVLMHGFMGNRKLEPLKTLAKELEAIGIASLRFDFDGHGKSDGKFCEMSVGTELADAQAVYDYAASLDYVSKIAFVGHSQGGVVAGMTAGKLGSSKITCLVQLSAAAVLKDDALNGVLMGKHYDPKNPPEHLWVFLHKVGRCYFEFAQKIEIYETSAAYDGPVCLIHGKDDTVVPYSYSERYHETYRDSELHLLDGENHILSKRRPEVMKMTVDFLKKHLL